MLFDSSLFAPAWRSIAKAMGDKTCRAVLDKTVCVELHHDLGVRLVAGNSYVYATVWIPMVTDGDTVPEEPPLELEPTSLIVVQDHHGRAVKLMDFANTLAKAAEKDDDEAPRVRIEILTPNADGMLDPSMAARQMRISVAGSTEILDSIESPYAEWRDLMIKRSTNTTDHFGLGTATGERIFAVAKALGAGLVRFDMNGILGAIKLDFVDKATELHLQVVARPNRLAEDREEPTPVERTSAAWGDNLLDDVEKFLAETVQAESIEDSPEWPTLVGNVARFVAREMTADTATLAGHFGLGLAMVDRVLGVLEQLGIVSPAMDTTPPRQILVSSLNVIESLVANWKGNRGGAQAA